MDALQRELNTRHIDSLLNLVTFLYNMNIGDPRAIWGNTTVQEALVSFCDYTGLSASEIKMIAVGDQDGIRSTHNSRVG